MHPASKRLNLISSGSERKIEKVKFPWSFLNLFWINSIDLNLTAKLGSFRMKKKNNERMFVNNINTEKAKKM